MKYDLRVLEGHNVKILCNNGKTFVGYASDYIFPDDNDDNIESIIIELEENGALIELKQTVIKSITIIK